MWLLLVVWFISNSRAQLLRDYHQSDYDVKLERCEVIQFNHSIYKVLRADFVPFNRTHRALNASLNVIADLSSNIKADVQVYKFMSNEYRFFPITVSVNACSEIHRNTFHLKTLLEKSTNLPECPWKKGYYYARYSALDFSTLPPYMPRGSYKIEAKLYDKSSFMFEFNAYYSVSDKPIKWKT